jgi:hypothetical protein
MVLGSGNVPNPIADGQGPSPEDDKLMDDGLSVIQAIQQYRIEAEDARRDRVAKNDQNWDLYLGRQDFSGKQEGQSTEVLPKVAISAEQTAAMIKRGMVQFGEYYTVKVDPMLADKVEGRQIAAILNCFLDDLWTPNKGDTGNFPTVISDAVKQALFKSLIILKVHGNYKKHRDFKFEKGTATLSTEDTERWHLRIDLVRVEDYYVDPTGDGLYEIHRVERDLHEVLAAAEEGIYDKAMVRKLVDTSFERPDDEELSDNDRAQVEATHPGFRRRVVLDEFWGTLLNRDGTVAHRNVVATVANDRFLIRKPEPNPFWHQESPFVAAPLVRVPFSVWHKAIYDHATDLNLALNELFNLMVDGAMATVHGVKQLRIEDLEDPGQVEGGIKAGITLAVKQTLPHNAKVLETVTEGEVPQDAMAMFEMINREFQTAAMTNELKVGALPPRQVLASEIMESSQSQNMMLDGMVGDLENNVMSQALRKAWLNVLQMADVIPESAFTSATDRRVAMIIMRASPEERYALFANKASFKVNGITATLTKALDFQKIMALLQAVGTNPALLQVFLADYSAQRVLAQLIRTLGLSPDELKKSFEEQQAAAQEQQLSQVNAANQFLGGGPQNAEGEPGGGGAAGPGAGGSPQVAGIQQMANPATGMPPVG